LGDPFGETLLDKLLPLSGGDRALRDSVKKKRRRMVTALGRKRKYERRGWALEENKKG